MEEKGFRFNRREEEQDLNLEEARPSIYHCDKCTAKFDSRQALQAHKWRQHQVLSEERKLLKSPICRACGRNFWTMARAQQHLRRTRQKENSCFAKLYLAIQPTETPCQATLPEHLRGVYMLPTRPGDGTTSTLERAIEPRVADAQQGMGGGESPRHPGWRKVSTSTSSLGPGYRGLVTATGQPTRGSRWSMVWHSLHQCGKGNMQRSRSGLGYVKMGHPTLGCSLWWIRRGRDTWLSWADR